MALGMLHVDSLMRKVSGCISAVFNCERTFPRPPQKKVTVAPQLKHIAVKPTSI